MVAERQPAIEREPTAIFELGGLLGDPVFYGLGVPRGDGRLVVVLPGMFANDFYLQPLRDWLSRIGYRAVRSNIAMNAGCPERRRLESEAELRRRMRRHSGRVALIGHSAGGVIARALAADMQDDVSHLILLGSPAGSLGRRWDGIRRSRHITDAARMVATAGERARRFIDPDCEIPQCDCAFVQDVSRPLAASTRVTSIYSREDPIVPIWASRDPTAENIEITGTHSGLAFNGSVYRAIAKALSVRD
jgi:triacylglycerol lipase